MSNSGLRRVIGASAVAAVAAVGLASMGAGNAAAGPLPSGSKTTVGVDGTVVTLKRTGEGIYPVPSLAANGAGRAGELSGTYTATAPKGSDIKLTVYVVTGCQINISGLSGTLAGNIDLLGATGGASFGLSIPLTPGQTAVSSINSKEAKDGGKAIVQLRNYPLSIQGCGGYAQARTYVQAVVSGNYYVQTSLWGQPASLN
ncbi:MAG: MspA family porin [Corynebacteriales bacterium]|uniref:MspA family porin n=1 Tax=Williamsia herbipolensis TaxID=1603258 RepID=A0AAU4K1K3_9NOCA|nr:MspA family porin [Williamsia herbipolensis]MCX6469168.1 MspA family porin [Mycobacteriales bacterium]